MADAALAELVADIITDANRRLQAAGLSPGEMAAPHAQIAAELLAMALPQLAHRLGGDELHDALATVTGAVNGVLEDLERRSLLDQRVRLRAVVES